MPKQPAFPGLRDAMKKQQTRRELFLSEMDAVVPLDRLLALIVPHYPQVRSEGRSAADAAGDMSRDRNRSGGSISRRLAAGLFPAKLGCAERSDGGGFKREAIDPVDRL